MKTLRTIITNIIAIAAVLLMGAASAEDFPKPTFDTDGKLNRPDVSYREWVYIGTWYVPLRALVLIRRISNSSG